MNNIQQQSSSKLHSIGFWLSALCAVHCLLLPLLLVTASFVSIPFISHPLFEVFLLPIAFIIGGYTLYNDFLRHQQYLPTILYISSIVVILLAFIIHNHPLIGLGTSLMAIAQLINWRLHKKHCHGHNHKH